MPVRAAESVDVDGLLGSHSDASLKFAASDGGVIINGETGDVIEEDEEDEEDEMMR